MKSLLLLLLSWAYAVWAFGGQRISPVVSLEGAPPSCWGMADGRWTLTLEQGAVPVSFTWTLLSSGIEGNGQLTEIGQPFHLTALRAGTYRFIFTAADGAIQAVDTVLSEPQLLQGSLFVFEPPDPCVRPGWAIGFAKAEGGTPPYTYRWSDGTSSMRLDSITSGFWSVEVTDARGCRTIIDSALALPEPLQAEVRVSGVRCAGQKDGRLTLDSIHGGVPPYHWQLDGIAAQGQRTWEGLAPGWYQLLVVDAVGCSLQVAALVPDGPSFSLDTGPDTTIVLGDTLYRWLTADQPLKEVRWQPTRGVVLHELPLIGLAPYVSTTYHITAVSTEGCTAGATLRVEVKRERDVYAPNVFWPEAALLENRTFTLWGEGGVEQIALLQVFDRWGQLCFEGRQLPIGVSAVGWDGTVLGQQAPAGVYTWRAVVRDVRGREVLLSGEVTLVR